MLGALDEAVDQCTAAWEVDGWIEKDQKAVCALIQAILGFGCSSSTSRNITRARFTEVGKIESKSLSLSL